MVASDNPLPGVPLVESPFFDDLFDPADPIYPIARSLHEYGYAVIDFPEPDFAELAASARMSLDAFFDWEAWYETGSNLRVQDAWKTQASVRQIATNPHIIELLGRLYGRRAFPFQTLNFPVGSQQHVHTDSVHFSSRPERFMCGVWVALEDVTEDQGPLIYYPGSHKLPIYTREHIGRPYFKEEGGSQGVFEPMWRRLIEAHGLEPETFYPRRGQGLIWAANLLHGGDVHRDRQRTRWSQVTHYYFEDCTYYTPLNSNEPRGDVYQREPFDILSGERVEGRYLGHPLSAPIPRPAPAPEQRFIAVPEGFPPFDVHAYVRLNPDVAGADIDPATHFDLYGRYEQRRWFDD